MTINYYKGVRLYLYLYVLPPPGIKTHSMSLYPLVFGSSTPLCHPGAI